jgi:hypothetical protein
VKGAERRWSYYVLQPVCNHISGEEVVGSAREPPSDRGSEVFQPKKEE